MAAEFVIARNPDEGSALPYLLRIPLGDGVVLKARDTWPRTAKVYCHRADGWPDDPEIVQRVPVRACVRRGVAIDLVLDRAREHRSQIVFTVAQGREAIFWQTARTARKARPRVTIPTTRAAGTAGPLIVVVDTQEKYPYRFTRQQVTVVRRRLPAGDYAVEGGGQLAAVERKSLADLLTGLSTGTLGYALADLATLARAALVVEDRYARLLDGGHVRPAVAADALAEAQVRWPAVPIVFCDTRPLAEEWTYRWLAAAHHELVAAVATADLEATLTPAGPLPPAEPTASEIRAWAGAQGYAVADRGRIPATLRLAYDQHNQT